MIRLFFALWFAFAAVSTPGWAQEFSALARLDGAASAVRDDGDGVRIVLSLSQPVPYRIGLMDSPPRLVVDFREVDWNGTDLAALNSGERVIGLRAGALEPGWSRLVAELEGPFTVESAGMQTGQGSGGAWVDIRLKTASASDFAAALAAAPARTWGDAPAASPPAPGTVKRRQTGDAPLVVVLDPGHGGIDPGAETPQANEAELILAFARELKEAMLRAGGMTVVLTRESDTFVPLETRISLARAVGADLFISLHADALAEGQARGATVYTLADAATDTASAALAERHDRADLLAGVDLSEQDDRIAGVMMEMARVETDPRSDRLAGALVEAIQAAELRMHKHPHMQAAFSVLKSPDIPSVLLELGFLSNPHDLANILDADWRARMARAVVSAVQAWALADAAEARLIRQ